MPATNPVNHAVAPTTADAANERPVPFLDLTRTVRHDPRRSARSPSRGGREQRLHSGSPSG